MSSGSTVFEPIGFHEIAGPGGRSICRAFDQSLRNRQRQQRATVLHRHWNQRIAIESGTNELSPIAGRRSD